MGKSLKKIGGSFKTKMNNKRVRKDSSSNSKERQVYQHSPEKLSEELSMNLSSQVPRTKIPLPNMSNQHLKGHAGQKSIKIDLKLGWKPTNFNYEQEADDAIAIRLTYPEHKNVYR